MRRRKQCSSHHHCIDSPKPLRDSREEEAPKKKLLGN